MNAGGRSGWDAGGDGVDRVGGEDRNSMQNRREDVSKPSRFPLPLNTYAKDAENAKPEERSGKAEIGLGRHFCIAETQEHPEPSDRTL